jgi:ATPase subunit of ABC transporter with duplicated ATPase domains
MRTTGTLVAADITKHHGPQLVLADVTVVVPPGSRIGLVGANGVGKSTLLRVLAGIEEPDGGAVRRIPPDLRVGYLPQEPDTNAGETLLAYLERRTGIADAARTMDALAARLARDHALAAKHAAALERFLALGGSDLKARAAATCAELGLTADLAQPTGSLSGGERARAALAAILLARFDVFLLDEPTNDLDLDGLDRLERFVLGLAGAAVIVSHDREFLDRTVTRIVELDEGSHRAREFAGGWSEHEAERRRSLARHYERWEEYVGERARIGEQQRRMQQWEERGYGQGRKKKKSKDVKKAYAKKLDRLEAVEKPYEPWELRLSLAARGRSGDVVARLEGVVAERGTFRLGPLDLELAWGDRLALTGSNGSGKTTLLDILTGRLPLAAGSRFVGPGVVIGELEQRRESFARREPLLDLFVRESALRTEDARTLLAKFDLAADHVLRPAHSLSPGERTRASLALLSARGVNCLVLDEPTNHLDVEAIEQLELALAGYDGTLVVVTHDRRFVERLAPTRTLELRPSRARGAPGALPRRGGRRAPARRAGAS